MEQSSQPTGFTFQVDCVEVCQQALPTCSAQERTCAQFKIGPSSLQGICAFNFSKNQSLPISNHACCNHLLVDAIDIAYSNHYPLSISPDAIWLTIAQGLANHISVNAQLVQDKFVNFQGKRTLIVNRDNFVLNSLKNDWAGVISEFSSQIQQFIGKETHELVVSNFSTTGPVERITSEAVLMDCMKEFFGYEVHTRCGIPYITIEGTVEDWKEIKTRVQKLDKYGLEWWTPHLQIILDEFITAAQGKPTVDFWQKIYKEQNSSGGPYISGWITDLFPYLGLVNKHKNANLGYWKSSKFTGRSFGTPFTSSSIPSSSSIVPVKWKYLGSEIELELFAGFVLVSQHTVTKAVRPEMGWAVANKRPEVATKSK